MFDLSVIRKSVLSLCLIFPLKLFGSTEFSLDYNFDAELHKEDDDEVISEFSAGLKGDHTGRAFNAAYDLDIDLVYEHQEKESNVLLDGDADSSYKLTPYLSWLFEIELAEISTAGNNEFDRLETQTFVGAGTGFRYELDNLVRGQLSFTAFRNEFYFEETPLDAREDSFETRYTRPVSRSSELTFSLRLMEQRYKEKSQVINDADVLRGRVGYSKSTSFYNYNLYVERNKIEFINQASNDDEYLDGYGFNFTYLINSRSSLLFIYSNAIEQAFQLNTNLVDSQNPVLEAGLVENSSTAVQYDLDNSRDTLSVRIYRNDIKGLSDVSTNDGITEGIIVDYTRVLSQDWSMDARHNEFKNEISDNEFSLSTVSAIYQINESAVFSSNVRLSIEDGSDNGRNIDDVVLIYSLTANII